MSVPIFTKIQACPPWVQRQHSRTQDRKLVQSMDQTCQVRSCQVRSECLTCTFRASCCSARLSQVPAFTGSSIRDRKTGGGEGVWGEPPALAGTREYEQSEDQITIYINCLTH